ncbi:uncharacterized protein LOC127807482 [Diospyros lotus]|uniref:uncharacterized protein LOC127807482 n=1 Tax=Diospyros lotus TaxID=55363 RepID=UPI002257B733|nr:uncharacterized protein LOC127807482 [Diospyros lotus]
MAARGGVSEGINLISSTYFDDDDDEEMEDIEPQEQEQELELEPPNNAVKDTKHLDDDIDSKEGDSNNNKSVERVSDFANDVDRTPLSNDDSTPKPLSKSRPSTPLQQQPPPPQISRLSPQQAPVDTGRARIGRLAIVDYGHDEAAMSPEAEEGEIVGTGIVMIDAQFQTSVGDIQERTPTGNTQALTPNAQASTPQLSEQLDASESRTMNCAVDDSESIANAEAVTMLSKDVDPLDRFLPPPPKDKCSDELQEKINKFLYLKRLGKSYNAEVRNKKEYRNPDFLRHAVTYQDIDEIGTCFSKDVFDPHGYDKSDFYDEIEADMKREMERKEQERKKSPKVEFVSGGTQPGVVASAPKVNIPIPGVSTAASGGLHPVPAAVESGSRDGRQNKKSKWDKVDGDGRNLLPPGGQDSVTSAGAHAALLTAANAGTGYTAFAQQRRKEAEEKRSSGKKDRRT